MAEKSPEDANSYFRTSLFLQDFHFWGLYPCEYKSIEYHPNLWTVPENESLVFILLTLFLHQRFGTGPVVPLTLSVVGNIISSTVCCCELI
jgi:hypothetical protein